MKKKIILDESIPLTPLANTVRVLRNLGYTVMNSTLIMECHNDRGGYSLTEEDVIKRICQVQRELCLAFPKVMIHLITAYYMLHMPSFAHAARYRIPPKRKWEDEALVEACKCLGVKWHKAIGVRYPTMHNDWLFRVTLSWNFLTTWPKMSSLLHKTSEGAAQKLIPEQEAMNHLVQGILSIPPAISNPVGLPKPILEAKRALEDSIKLEWEKNFNKSQEGKTRW